MTKGSVYLLYNIPFSFKNSKYLRTEDTSFWTSGRGMFSHFYLIQDSSCSVVLVLCHIFRFMTRQMLSSGEKSGLQAGSSPPMILHGYYKATQYQYSSEKKD